MRKFLLMVAVCATVGGAIAAVGSKDASSLAVPAIGTEGPVLQEYFACRDAKVLDRFYELALSKDKTAINRFGAANLANGSCIMLSKGDTVYVDNRSTLTVQVRYPGRLDDFWVSVAAFRAEASR